MLDGPSRSSGRCNHTLVRWQLARPLPLQVCTKGPGGTELDRPFGVQLAWGLFPAGWEPGTAGGEAVVATTWTICAFPIDRDPVAISGIGRAFARVRVPRRILRNNAGPSVRCQSKLELVKRSCRWCCSRLNNALIAGGGRHDDGLLAASPSSTIA